MFTYPRHMTRSQRDRLLQRAERLRFYCETSRRVRPAFHPLPRRDRRYRRVAARLGRFVAGVGRSDSTLPLIRQATRRHIAGITGYGEWIEELRWAGLPARAGATRLSPRGTAERQKRLNVLYPRVNAVAAVAAGVAGGCSGAEAGPCASGTHAHSSEHAQSRET